MKRVAFFVYGVAGHLLFLGVYALLAAWVANLFLPQTIDSRTGDPVGLAIAINLGLLLIFGLQHSVMARPSFKNVWTKIVPQPIERSTYVYFSCVVTLLFMWQWRAIDLTIWDIESPLGRWTMWGLFAAGWVMVPAVSLMINHFDLFGTRQVWLHLRGKEYTSLPFRAPSLYSRIRHPLYVGWMIAFWATPTMTAGHLLFAAGMTGYILIALRFEERNLVQHFGRKYIEYCRQVPRFIPRRGAAVIDPATEAATQVW